MATHICPNCKKDSFTWYIDDEISELTIWNCHGCNYQAYENESDWQFCSSCNSEIKSKLKDLNKDYWWCFNCKKRLLN